MDLGEGVLKVKLVLKKVGEHQGFCRKYYRRVDGREGLFALQESFNGISTWYTCTKAGEPDCRLRSDVEIEVHEGVLK